VQELAAVAAAVTVVEPVHTSSLPKYCLVGDTCGADTSSVVSLFRSAAAATSGIPSGRTQRDCYPAVKRECSLGEAPAPGATAGVADRRIAATRATCIARAVAHVTAIFPYSAVYILEPRLVVIALAHVRRRQGYWAKRLAEVSR